MLLLEAGGEEPLVADTPAFGLLLRNSNVDWAYTTQPEEGSCLSQPEGGCAWARGKVIRFCINILILTYFFFLILLFIFIRALT